MRLSEDGWIAASFALVAGVGMALDLLYRNHIPLFTAPGASVVINTLFVAGIPATLLVLSLLYASRNHLLGAQRNHLVHATLLGLALLAVLATGWPVRLRDLGFDELSTLRLPLAALLAGIALSYFTWGAWRRWLIRSAPAVALTLAMAVYASSGGRLLPPNTHSHSPGAVQKGWHGRILLVGVDGLSWDVLERWLRASDGRISPWLGGLARTPLQTFIPTRSPVIWSTIMTGAKPEDHGVVDFTSLELTFPWRARLHRIPAWMEKARTLVRDLPQAQEATVATIELQRKPFWEIIRNRPVYSIGWWVSWPARPLWGALVTDYFYFWRKEEAKDFRPDIDWLASTGITWPPELLVQLQPKLVRADQVSQETLERELHIRLPAGLRELESIPGPQPLEQLRTAYAMDETHFQIAEEFLQRGSKQGLYAVYVRGIDLVSHAALRFSELYPEVSSRLPASQVYGSLVSSYYAYTFRRIERLARLAGPDTLVLVVSDHGFEYDPSLPELFGHYHAPAGVLLASRPDHTPIRWSGQPTVYDICPTLLWLAGYAPAEDMPGRVLAELLPRGLPLTVASRVPTYGYRFVTSPGENLQKNHSRASVELLRRLGYLR